jgi:hypothetical protein
LFGRKREQKDVVIAAAGGLTINVCAVPVGMAKAIGRSRSGWANKKDEKNCDWLLTEVNSSRIFLKL